MGTWLVVNAKRKKKSCEQPPYAVTKKSPFHSSRLLSLILLPDSSSSFPTTFFLSPFALFSMTFRQCSRRSMRHRLPPYYAHRSAGKLLLFTDSTFEEFQELEYDVAGKWNGPRRAKWCTAFMGQ